jgi:hypothetical protein
MIKGNLEEVSGLDHMEMISLFVAACVHDYEHPGVNNVFLANIQDPIAVRHNDISVLENHHIAASFALMNADEQNNWMHKFKTDDFKRMRKLIIDAVFATDMSKHFGELG